jgi:hypothetical protein
MAATRSQLNTSNLSACGLNMQAVFDLAELPDELVNSLALSDTDRRRYSQLVLIGHSGPRFWSALTADQEKTSPEALSPAKDNHPVDQFTVNQVNRYFENQSKCDEFKVIYPALAGEPFQANLQWFGQLAGWHHSSPMAIGINKDSGTWFAYRAVVLTNSDYAKSKFPSHSVSPCDSCKTRDCIVSCPASAVNAQSFDVNACSRYRMAEQSQCKDRCVARLACPVSNQNQYTQSQIRYHYLYSLKIIRQLTVDNE